MKVVNLLRDYQKSSPMDLPYSNPSLFQSPGGRRFVSFLHIFSNFVLKMYVQKFEDNLLSKPVTKNEKLGRFCYSGLVSSTKVALEKASKDQAGIKEMNAKSRESLDMIGGKYFDIKKSLEKSLGSKFDQLKCFHSEVLNQYGEFEVEKLLYSYDVKCDKIRKLQDAFKLNGSDHEDLWANIMTVVDDSVPKLKLNFDEFPKQLVAVENMKMTYGNLITKVLSTTDKVLHFKPSVLPIQEMATGAATFTSQANQLTELKADLGTTVGKMMENVQKMLHTSSQIDWANCELSIPPLPSSLSQPVLLPPTPSLLDDFKRSNPTDLPPAIPSHLQFLSPSPTTPHPTLTVPPGSGLSCTRISTGQVTRRFPRRVPPDQSPLLKQSLIQSTLLRAGVVPEEEERNQDTNKTETEDPDHASKGSLSVFSPVLSSTKSPQGTFSRPSSRQGLDDDSRSGSAFGLGGGSSLPIPSQSFGSLRAAADASLSLDCTQSKIEMYRKILLSVKNKEKPNTEGKPSLLSVWNSHRQSLSPQCRPRPTTHSSSSSSSCNSPASPPKQFSPMLNCRTPDMSRMLGSPSQDMDSKLATRLDQLMTSLTFSDDSLDFGRGRMSLGGEELLSPHCPH